MISKKIVTKIQALLSSSDEYDALVLHVMALAYCRECVKYNVVLERCAAMIRAGREYHALKLAQVEDLFANIQVLSFKEVGVWEDYCNRHHLPFPPEFDAELIELVSGAYKNKDSLVRQFYRDYRRAMRLRDFENGLLVISIIYKLAPSDFVVKSEFERLRKNVLDRKINRLGDLLETGDIANLREINAICDFLGKYNDCLGQCQVFENATQRLDSANLANFSCRASEILKELELLSVESDFEKVISLLAELFSASAYENISSEELEEVKDIVALASKKMLADIDEQKARRAVAALAREFEKVSSESLSKRLAKLKTLRRQAKQALGAEATKILNKKISQTRWALFVRRMCVLSVTVVVVAILGGAGLFVSRYLNDKFDFANCEKSLNNIDLLDDPVRAMREVQILEAKYAKHLENPALSAKLSRIKAQVSAGSEVLTRLQGLFERVEKIDFSKATPSDCAKVLEILEKISSDIYLLPASIQTSHKKRLEKLQMRVADIVEMLKSSVASDVKALLDEYETLLRDYENFSKPRAELDAKFDDVSPKLRALMEITVDPFRPHQIDVNRYNDISGRITDSKSRYADFDEKKKALLSSKSFIEYIAVAKLLKENPFIPPSFYKNLSKIVEQTNQIKYGQLVDFAVAEAADCTERVGEFARMSDELPPILGDVYFYNRSNGRKFFAQGKPTEKINVWGSGKESIQRASEILENGIVNQTLFRLHQVDGEAPTGEILSAGMFAPESAFARTVAEVATQESLLLALERVGSGKVSPIFKLMLEKYLFERMREVPIFSGLLFSKSALARERLVRKYSRELGYHSWLFEPASRSELIEKELYSAPLPDLRREARICIAALVEAKKYPIKMIGIMSDSGKPIFFGDKRGDIWAVEKTSGEFKKISKGLDNVENIAPLSPIFTEIKSAEEFWQNAEASVK